MSSRAYLGFRLFRLCLAADAKKGYALVPTSWVGAGDNPWDQEALTAEARCYGRPKGPHAFHACGLHAVSRLSDLEPLPNHLPTVRAVVAATGMILRSSRGFRAQRMTVLGLFEPEISATWMLRRKGQEPPSWREWAEERAPLLPFEQPFHDDDYVREFAFERNCVAYFDVVKTEEEIGRLEAALSREAWRV